MTSISELPPPAVPFPLPERAQILGVEIDRLTMEETVRRCAELIESGGPAQHVSVNVAKIVSLRDDPRLRTIIEQCEVVSVDGQPVVWASRLLGDPLPERVAGIDLMFNLLGLSERRGYRVYLLGGKLVVLETSPVTQSERAQDLCAAAGRTLLTVEAPDTRVDGIAEAVSLLEVSNAGLLGAVLLRTSAQIGRAHV